MLLQLRTKEGYSVTWLKKSKKFVFRHSLRTWADDQVEDMIGVGQGGALAFMDNDFGAVESCGGET